MQNMLSMNGFLDKLYISYTHNSIYLTLYFLREISPYILYSMPKCCLVLTAIIISKESFPQLIYLKFSFCTL